MTAQFSVAVRSKQKLENFQRPEEPHCSTRLPWRVSVHSSVGSLKCLAWCAGARHSFPLAYGMENYEIVDEMDFGSTSSNRCIFSLTSNYTTLNAIV